MTSNSQLTYRLEFLDVLRGVAILAVMLLHFGDRGCGAGDSLVLGRVWLVLSHGYLGVEAFFVISGYCITAAVYDIHRKGRPMHVFLTRRARRIFIPYWWSMLLVVVLGAGTVLLMKKPWRSVFPLTPMDWMLNVLLLQRPFGAPDVSLVYWSLSIEIQFYLVMAACAWRKELTERCLIAFSAASAILLCIRRVSISGTILAYWPEFACGIAAFYWITGERCWAVTPWCLAGLTAGSAMLVWLTSSCWHERGHLGLPIRLAFCLAVAVSLVSVRRYDWSLCRQTWARLLAFFGRMSYTLYLIHVPVATRVFNFGERATGLAGLRWLVYASLATVIVLFVGRLFFRFCEQPWLNSRPKAMCGT